MGRNSKEALSLQSTASRPVKKKLKKRPRPPLLKIMLLQLQLNKWTQRKKKPNQQQRKKRKKKQKRNQLKKQPQQPKKLPPPQLPSKKRKKKKNPPQLQLKKPQLLLRK